MSLTTRERQEIAQANASGLKPVVFVHGLWMLASSWAPWRAFFEENGYATLAPGLAGRSGDGRPGPGRTRGCSPARASSR